MNKVLAFTGCRNAMRLRRKFRFQSGKTSGSNRVALISTHGYVAADPPLGSADTGGQVVYVLELAKSLAELGLEVDIWTRKFENQPEFEAVNEQVRILRMECGGRAFIPKEYLWRHLEEWASNASTFIRSHNLKYRFINSHYWDAGVAGIAMSALLRIPHLHTPHSIGIWKMRQMEIDAGGPKKEFEERYNFSVRNTRERDLYRSSDMVIATTPLQLEMLRDEFRIEEDRLGVVTPGYDDRRFYPVGKATRETLRRRFGFEGKVVVGLGRLAKNKGYDLLLRGFAGVVQRIPEARLYLAAGGDSIGGRERETLDECTRLTCELGLESKVKFAGYVSEENLPDLYRAADLFVLSSRYEPFGMTAVEAMACGTPVVATTHGGLWKTFRYGVEALWADVFDEEDLAITMCKPLRSARLASRLSSEGADFARREFTWTHAAHQLLGTVDGKEYSEVFAESNAANVRTIAASR